MDIARVDATDERIKVVFPLLLIHACDSAHGDKRHSQAGSDLAYLTGFEIDCENVEEAMADREKGSLLVHNGPL